MDREIQPVIAFIRYMKLAEGDIANGNIEEIVREGGFLIALHCNTAFLIKLAGDAAREIIQLHAVELAAAHAFRQHTEKIADTAGRLQNVALREAHLPQGGIDAADDHGRRKERRERGFTGSGVFGIGKQFFQFSVTRIFLVKEVRQTAPAHILCQHCLFFCGGAAVLRLHDFQGTDGVQIALKTLQRCALSDMVIGDAVVPAIRVQRIGKCVLLFLFRRGERRRRLVRLRCRGFLRYVRLLHVSADIVDGFLLEDGKSRPAFKSHIPQGYILCMIVYAVHFKLPPIYGQACTDGERFGDFRFHGQYGLRWRWHGFLGGCRSFLHQRRCRLIGCGQCQLPIVPVIEQAELTVYIGIKLKMSFMDKFIVAVIFLHFTQPGIQCVHEPHCSGLILQFFFNQRYCLIIIHAHVIGTRHIVRRIVQTGVNGPRHLSPLIFWDLCDGILAGEAFLRDQVLILLDHIGDGQMDAIIFLETVVPFIVQPLSGFRVLVSGTTAAAVLAKKGFDKLLVFGCVGETAEMGIYIQSGIYGLTQKISVNLVLRNKHFALPQEIRLCGEVALRQVQTVQHNADAMGVIVRQAEAQNLPIHGMSVEERMVLLCQHLQSALSLCERDHILVQFRVALALVMDR